MLTRQKHFNIPLAKMFTLAVLVVAPVSAQTVYVDYDRSVEFDSYHTFAFVNSGDGSMAEESPFIHRTIEWAILNELTAAGLQDVPSNPDLYVTYYTASNDRVTFNTASLGYSYGSCWYWHPYWGGYGGVGPWGTNPTTHIYNAGTLVIDIWDAKTKQAIFRGTAQAKPKTDPKKFSKQVTKVVDKIGDEFDSMYAKGE